LRRIEWKKLGSLKVSVSALAGESQYYGGSLALGFALLSCDNCQSWYKGRRERRQPADHREIERGFVGAGWRVTDDSSEHLLVGNRGKLSILAYESSIGADDPAFELLDRRRVLTYWVRVIPTPRQAAVLLEEHSGLPEEERGSPYKK
jgi:hypothetical protein